ncbi:MAG: hypothetical protein ABJK28_03990, partial [Algibacter sp.]
MKTICTQKNALFYAFFYLLFFGISTSGFSQCPTVDNSTPSPICEEGSGLTYEALTTLLVNDGSITTNGATIRWYTSLTGGTPFSSNELVRQEGVFYIDDNDDLVDCSPRGLINISFAVSATNSEFEEFYCSDENPTVETFINDALQSFIPSGGIVTVYNDFSTNDVALPAQAITSSAAFEVVFQDAGGCTSQIENGLAIYIDKPDAPIITSPQSFCNSGGIIFTIADIDIGTATNVEWYNSSDASGLNLDSTTVINNGDILFALVSTFPFPCDSETTQVEIVIDEPFDPGTPGSLEYCNNSVPTTDLNLFNELGGALKDSNGTWSGGPFTTSNGNLGTVNITTLTTPGVYTFTYTVPSNGLCPENSSDVTITILLAPESGTANTPVEFCEGAASTSFDLYSLITGESGTGTWTNNNTSTVVASPESIDLSGFTADTYNFTFNIDPIGGCDDVDVVASIIINPLPNTGIPNNPPAFCENDLALSNTAFDLFTLLGAPVDSGGTWYDGLDTTGTVITNSLDLSQLTIGIHNFTYGITDANTCTNNTTVTITIDEAPESGTTNTPVEFCEGIAPTSFDLYSLIAGESGTGVWTNNNTSIVVASPESIDLSGFTADTYNFTFNIDPIGGCDDVDVVASIIINPLPNTGTPNNPPAFCENDSALSNTAFDLFTLLGAPVDSGGTWYDGLDITGTVITNSLDLSQLTIGIHNFTYGITDANTCTNSTTVTITIDEAPESGTANTPVEFCEGVAPTSFDLYSLITGESETGVWTNNNTSTVVASPESIDLSGFTADTYNFTFNINPIGGCDDVDVV